MASLFLNCIVCCCPHAREKHSFLAAATTPKHKRHAHNTPRTMNTTGRETRGHRVKTSGEYTFEVLKIENERRVRKLAEAGVMDVPHGVLSREVGTPEVVPRYGDVVEADAETWRLEGGVQGGDSQREREPGGGVGGRAEEEWVQSPERVYLPGAAVR